MCDVHDTLLDIVPGDAVGVEIGVSTGKYSELLLRETELNKLYSVDKVFNRVAARKLKAFGARSEYIIERSVQAAAKFEDVFFDFIYIDAGHRYDAVVGDLSAWWPKLKEGGLFSGDDYYENEKQPWGLCQVKRAVDEFVDEHGLELNHIGGGRTWSPDTGLFHPSWYTWKL